MRKPAPLLQAPDWRIVPLADGTPAALDPTVKTWSEHLAALDTLNRGSHLADRACARADGLICPITPCRPPPPTPI